MSKKSNDTLIFVGVTIAWILLIIGVNMIPASTPDLSEPSLPETTSSSNPSEPLISSTFSVKPDNDQNSETINNIAILLKKLLYVFLFIVIYLLYRLIMANYKGFKLRKIRKEKHEEVENKDIYSLKMASINAEKILQEALKMGNYTEGVIKAYHVLDKQLASFREIARPEYWTPKEYAYRVKEPIYQNAVKGIVEIFYKVRYGQKSATKEDVLDFLLFLKGIFIDKLNPSLEEHINSKISLKENYDGIYIPRVYDFTKPFKVYLNKNNEERL